MTFHYNWLTTRQVLKNIFKIYFDNIVLTVLEQCHPQIIVACGVKSWFIYSLQIWQIYAAKTSMPSETYMLKTDSNML